MDEPSTQLKKMTKMLKCIKTGLVIGATDGTEVEQWRDEFCYLDERFVAASRTEGINGPRPKTSVGVFEIVRDAKILSVLKSTNKCLQDLAFTPAQVVAFTIEHPVWLKNGGFATYFLLSNCTSVAAVFEMGDDLPVGINFRGLAEDENMCLAGHRLRLVLPV